MPQTASRARTLAIVDGLLGWDTPSGVKATICIERGRQKDRVLLKLKASHGSSAEVVEVTTPPTPSEFKILGSLADQVLELAWDETVSIPPVIDMEGMGQG